MSSSKGRPSPTSATASRTTEQCIALIDYDALSPDEISFQAGDVINVTGKGSASGFWEGCVAAPVLATVELGTEEGPQLPSPRLEQGFFPNCLVSSNIRFKSTLATYSCQNLALCLYAYSAATPEEMSLAQGDVVTAVRPSASPGWWYGYKSTNPPWTAPPSISTAQEKAGQRASTSTPAPAGSSRFADPVAVGSTNAAPELLFPTNFVTCDVVLISFQFTGRQPHELSCRSADVVRVHRRWNDGWWEGTLRHHRGIFPSNYSVPNVCSTAPPLFCQRCRTVFSSNLFQASCATCTAAEQVEEVMLQALEAYVQGEVKELDLFASVDVTPSASAAANTTVSDSDNADLRSPVNRRASAAQQGGGDAAARRRHRGRGDVRPAPESVAPRVSLLTETDMADLASNRVKLME